MTETTTDRTPEEIAAALRADKEFQERIDASPMRYDDDGVARVRVARNYYTVVQNQLVSAPIPSDLSRPSVWDPVPASDVSGSKARSMLGLT